MTIVLNWIEINRYATIIGPGVGRPARPAACPWCSATRVWFDRWRVVFAVVLADGSPHRFDDGLPIRRVCCAACDVSWALRPPFLYPHHTFEPDVSEAAALDYLSAPESTYRLRRRRDGLFTRLRLVDRRTNAAPSLARIRSSYRNTYDPSHACPQGIGNSSSPATIRAG